MYWVTDTLYLAASEDTIPSESPLVGLSHYDPISLAQSSGSSYYVAHCMSTYLTFSGFRFRGKSLRWTAQCSSWAQWSIQINSGCGCVSISTSSSLNLKYWITYKPHDRRRWRLTCIIQHPRVIMLQNCTIQDRASNWFIICIRKLSHGIKN